MTFEMSHFKFDFQSFKIAGEVFLEKLVSELKQLGFAVDKIESDHLCFRVSTPEEYEFYKKSLVEYGKLLAETHIGGRPICTFLLRIPFQTKAHTVKLVELPAPKTGSHYKTGFEHAEFVIQENFEKFRAPFANLKWTQSDHNPINPELCLKLEGKQAKFHHKSLEKVIELEKSNSL